MNPKLPLDGRIYMLTVGSVLTMHQCISNQSMSAFVQCYSQSQARLMFVATLEMDNFDCTKMNAHFKIFTALKAAGHDHLLGLAYDRKTWACPMSTVLATVAFLLLLDTSLLSQAGTSHYSQLLTLQHSTKLLLLFYFIFIFI